MIFEHRETGLQVVVHIREETHDVRDLDNRRIKHPALVQKRIETESGQPVVASNLDDAHELRAIKVLTTQGEVEMFLVE